MGSQGNSYGNNSTKLYNSANYKFAEYTTAGDEKDHTDDGIGIYGNAKPTAISIIPSMAISDDEVTYGTGDDAIETSGLPNDITNGVRVQSGVEDITNLMVTDSDGNTTEFIFLIPPTTPWTKGDDASYSSTPATNTGLEEDEIFVEVTYDIFTIDKGLACNYTVSSTNVTSTVALNEGTMKQGYAYRYILTITGNIDDDSNSSENETLTNISISANVVEWDETYEKDDSGNSDTDDWVISDAATTTTP